ncbi:hypothetical protein PIB30_113633, partial [Stylosanthes scabra]|nr:hypothetical protein [Stylosanthes scabra]
NTHVQFAHGDGEMDLQANSPMAEAKWWEELTATISPMEWRQNLGGQLAYGRGEMAIFSAL